MIPDERDLMSNRPLTVVEWDASVELGPIIHALLHPRRYTSCRCIPETPQDRERWWAALQDTDAAD